MYLYQKLRKIYQKHYQQHYPFLMVLLLFVSFRLLAILLFRPGGFIADFSDYDFYYTWGQLTPMGYQMYENLWTAYPPLFPALMLQIFELSARIPPWIEPRLLFHTLLGIALLFFETGNLLLIYRLSSKLGKDRALIRGMAQSQSTHPPNPHSIPPHLLPPILYALLFIPVYTLLGWFESMPLFFMLLGLELLLSNRRWGWVGTSVFAALGFLTKLTPALLIPIGIRWLGSKLNLSAIGSEWFNPKSSGNLLKPTLYVLLFMTVVIAVGYPFVQANPNLALSSFRVQSIRPPWQSLWALIDGYFGYGLVPLDMRNLIGLERNLWESHLPWTWISIAFGCLYLFLYTRKYNWKEPRTPIAFASVSVIILFFYSKGWSPQFLVWILAFIVLLLPTMRGMVIATLLSLINFVEASLFLVILPQEHWLMWGTVLLRTALLLLLVLEFLGQIWPKGERGRQMQRISTGFTWLVLLVASVGTIGYTPTAIQAYYDRRFAEHPCQEAVLYLQAEADWPNQRIVGEQINLWQQLYPWLRESYGFHIIDTYSPIDEPASYIATRKLSEIGQMGEFWWISQPLPTGEERSSVAVSYFSQPDVHHFEPQKLGSCALQRVLDLTHHSPQAVADVSGGPISLHHIEIGRGALGEALHVVLYWQADAPVDESYTVFTQLFDSANQLIAQQDNIPVSGLAPTSTWQPQTIIRDPYRLHIPENAPKGTYRLQIGLYNEDGRRMLQLPDNQQQDYLEISISISSPFSTEASDNQ